MGFLEFTLKTNSYMAKAVDPFYKAEMVLEEKFSSAINSVLNKNIKNNIVLKVIQEVDSKMSKCIDNLVLFIMDMHS